MSVVDVRAGGERDTPDEVVELPPRPALSPVGASSSMWFLQLKFK